jgi:citrate synthase
MVRKLKPEEQKWCIDPETGEPIINKGVQNVCIDKTTISFIDGYHSKLYYRGYSIEEIAKESTFEEVTYLLLYGHLPNKKELEDFSGWLREERNIPDPVIDLLYNIPQDIEPMEMLRTAVSYLGNLDPGRHDLSRDSIYRKAIRLISKMPTIVAYFHRIKNNMEIVEPDPRLSHAENFLHMFHGKKPSKLHTETMDLSLKLYAEHGMNASTFTTVVIASTLSDYYSAIVGGLGALRGPLHGYANVLAVRQFEEIGSPENVERWFKENIETGKKRLMGFGHRVYKSYDPRAKLYREVSTKLADDIGGDVKRVWDIALKLEEIALKSKLAEKKIFTNTDFYSGLVYMALGIPIEFYCTLFAISRVVGWTAHILEYIEKNRIIRPRIFYVGEVDKEYTPIEKRG